jgi:hypothetical protein
MLKVNLLALVGITFCLAGCANLQMYDGPKQPESAVVMINGMSSWDISAEGLAVKVCKFDGKPLSSCQPFIEFLPGKHTLTIELTMLGIREGDDVDVTQDFLPGDRYDLDVGWPGTSHQIPALVYTGNVNNKDSQAH